LRWVREIKDAAEAYQDPDLLILGHYGAVNAYFWLGELLEAREHADRVLALYTEERHGNLLAVMNQDLKTMNLVFLAWMTWILGYPEQAMKIAGERDAHSRRLGHPFDLGFALTIGGIVFNYLGIPDEALKRVDEAERLGRDNSLPPLTDVMVPLARGAALVRKGQFAEGIASLKSAYAVWEAGGGRNSIPWSKSLIAEGMARLGDIDGALDVVEEGIGQIERPGWEERCFYAELLRLKAWMLSLKGDAEGAERNYIASLTWARTQQAKSWELRTATGYARLLQGQGRVAGAYDLLAPVYAWFPEGFATQDLKEAKALLDELADVPAFQPHRGSTAADAGADDT
jgi:predicted ATPase